jgi:hypothetical protein
MEHQGPSSTRSLCAVDPVNPHTLRPSSPFYHLFQFLRLWVEISWELELKWLVIPSTAHPLKVLPLPTGEHLCSVPVADRMGLSLGWPLPYTGSNSSPVNVKNTADRRYPWKFCLVFSSNTENSLLTLEKKTRDAWSLVIVRWRRNRTIKCIVSCRGSMRRWGSWWLVWWNRSQFCPFGGGVHLKESICWRRLRFLLDNAATHSLVDGGTEPALQETKQQQSPRCCLWW